jgi:hypothetical protein
MKIWIPNLDLIALNRDLRGLVLMTTLGQDQAPMNPSLGLGPSLNLTLTLGPSLNLTLTLSLTLNLTAPKVQARSQGPVLPSLEAVLNPKRMLPATRSWKGRLAAMIHPNNPSGRAGGQSRSRAAPS